MDDDERSSARLELIAVSASMLAGRMHLIEGVRRLNRLRFVLHEEENPIFNAIVSAESETDRFPVGSERVHWAPEALDRMDTELEEYIADLREQVLRCCESLIQYFSNR